MIFIVWGLLFCMLVMTHHVSTVEAHNLPFTLEDIRYSPSIYDEELKNVCTLDEKTYTSIGRRQTILGMTSIIILLVMFLTRPCYSFFANTLVFIGNGLVVTALISYTIGGLMLWNNSVTTLSEDKGEEIETES